MQFCTQSILTHYWNKCQGWKKPFTTYSLSSTGLRHRLSAKYSVLSFVYHLSNIFLGSYKQENSSHYASNTCETYSHLYNKQVLYDFPSCFCLILHIDSYLLTKLKLNDRRLRYMLGRLTITEVPQCELHVHQDNKKHAWILN